jgi:hydroxymethylbilane synthase
MADRLRARPLKTRVDSRWKVALCRPRMGPFTFATRRSALALAQSRAFVRSLEAIAPGLAVDELQVVTAGDRIQDRPLYEVGGKGLFVKEIEEALLEGRADFAVHSLKDLPAALPPSLVIACFPPREAPTDALVSKKYASLDALPRGASVGTSSLRRAHQLRALRPDLQIAPLRGNVDTRLGRVDNGDLDAILLAEAGLRRLGLGHRVTERLAPRRFVPAIGQGCLAIEAREGSPIAELLARVDDVLARRAVICERAVQAEFGGDCRTPLGAFASRERSSDGDRIKLLGWASEEDGSKPRRAEVDASWPASDDEAIRLGRELAHTLLRA